MGTATFFGPPKIETEEVPTAGANPNPIPILIPIPIPNPKPNPNPSPNPNPNPNPSPSPNPNPNQVPTAEAKAAAAVALARTPLLLKFDKEKIYEWQACNRGCRGCNRGCLGGSTRGRCCIPTAPREERQKRSASDASRYQTVLSACTRHALGMQPDVLELPPPDVERTDPYPHYGCTPYGRRSSTWRGQSSGRYYTLRRLWRARYRVQASARIDP